MAAWFVKAPHHRKPHVISQGMKSAVSTLYTTACGQIVRYRFDNGVTVMESGTVAADDLCGICRSKTKQVIA